MSDKISNFVDGSIQLWKDFFCEEPGSKRKCKNCGRTIPEDARTCPYCNKKFW